MQISPFNIHWSLHPHVYIAPYTSVPIKIDGDAEKPVWKDVPWSSHFDDIRGASDAPPEERPNDDCRTKMKMMWDNEFLYIAAIIESDMEVRATFKERNSPIYHEDSDFEVFLDPSSSCHYYKELEMNALNTVWNLMLDKPYADGGQEYSGRIARPGEPNYYGVQGQKTAVRLIEGSLNNGDDKRGRTVWSVEIALCHSDTLKFQPVGLRHIPRVGDMWRINFSRVEKKGRLNWTWQKQRVWDPEKKRHCGKVDMHLPDAWGYLRFGPSLEILKKENGLFGQVPEENILRGEHSDPDWPMKLAAMNIYYAQQYLYTTTNRYAHNHVTLHNLLDDSIMKPFHSAVNMTVVEGATSSFVVHIKGGQGGNDIILDNHREMQSIRMTSKLSSKGTAWI
mmetsp:Transcript_8076/g.15204  ORF Transcript_8076/g.15204 Transcript_8076/m.15204 type:complete len:394 (-) Transcript_8076:1231-2412(-)